MRPTAAVCLSVVTLVAAACGDAAGSAVPTLTVAEVDPASLEIPEDFLTAVVADAATLAGTASTDVEVARAEPTAWADGRLGCVRFEDPGTGPEDGYWVVLHAAGLEFDYRLDAAGAHRLCGEPLELQDGVEEHEPVEESER